MFQNGITIIFFACLFVSGIPSVMLSQLDIEVTVEDYDKDTMYLGYYFGNKKYFYDTAASETNTFTFEADTSAPHGMYLLLDYEMKNYHDILLEEDQQFSLKTDSSFSVDEIVISGSGINQDFYKYIQFLTELRPRGEELNSRLPDAEAQSKLDALNDKVVSMQKELMDKHPGSILAATIRSNMEMEMPEFDGDEREVKLKRYHYFKDHYFDGVDLGKEKYNRAPFFYPYVSRYIEQVVPQHPDSIIKALDRVLQPMLESRSEAFKFFLVHYLNHYARSNIVGMDGVYVHLVNEYYKTGKAWWTNEEQLKKILDEVEKIEPTLIGKIAPDVRLKKLENNEELSLHEINTPYTVLFFWDPECGHCKKSMPDVIEFYENYKDKGISFIAVCTKLNQDARDKCLEYIKEREGMNIFTNVYDPFLRSRYKQKYDIRSTPKVFILDSEKKILMKNVPAEKLSEVMDQILYLKQSSDYEKLVRSEGDKTYVSLTKMNGGTYLLPVKINGLTFDVILDSGASSLSISFDILTVMIKQGTISKDDIIGAEYYQLADGTIKEGVEVNIKKFQIGNTVLEDVKASVSFNYDVPLLLGQSVLSRFGKVTVDNEKNLLILE